MKKVWFVVALFALASLGSSSLSAQSQPPPLDHFFCYYVPNQNPLTISFTLQDQFDAAMSSPLNFEHITSETLARICNTAQKTIGSTVTPMTNVNHHLTMYQLNPQPIVPRTVTASNQFGSSQTLNVFDSRFVLLPAFKCILPCPVSSIPTDLDHYKCYAASGARVFTGIALIKDEFTSVGPSLLNPVLFCNPTIKIRNNTTTSIQNNRDHLVCYAITPVPFGGIPDASNPSSPSGIVIFDQFQQRNVTVQQPDMLCTPSAKLSWSVVPPASSAFTAKPASHVSGN